MTPLCTTLFLLAAPLPAVAQATGGETETLLQLNGMAEGDLFGSSTSNAGDVNADGIPDILVGAPFASPNGILEAGSIFVYSGADATLLYEWHGSFESEVLGLSTSGAGDVNADGFADLIIGSAYSSPGGLDTAGSALVYSGADGSLLHQWHGSRVGYGLGSSVSDAGDVNNDGFADVIVGSPFAFVPPAGQGTARVYSGADGTMLYEWGGEIEGHFGGRVAAAGDLNNDGSADLLVSEPGRTANGITHAGSVFAFSGADGSQLYQWSGDQPYGDFGNAISKAGDVNMDGYPDVIIGFSGKVTNSIRGGSVSVFSGADGTRLHRWVGQTPEYILGISVADAGDVNDDGYADLLIGSIPTIAGLNSGLAHLYSGMDGMLLHSWEGQSAWDHFGFSVDGAGDIDGDGNPDLMVGASHADPGGVVNAGTVSVYSFHAYMHANTANVSAATGGVINLDLNFPTAAGLTDYKILISKTGIGPIHFGVDIPLSMDQLVNDTAYGNYPVPVHNNMHGTLDASGNASGSITIPAGIPLDLVGHSIYLAAVAHPTGQLPEYSSVATRVTIMP